MKLKQNKIELAQEQTKSYEQLKVKERRVIRLNDEAKIVVERNLKKNKTGLLFQNPQALNRDNRWEPNAIKMRFTRAKKKLGFYFTQRSIRKYWATEFVKNGGNIAAGAKLMGHTSTDMLLNVYQDVGKDEKFLVEQANLVKPVKLQVKVK